MDRSHECYHSQIIGLRLDMRCGTQTRQVEQHMLCARQVELYSIYRYLVAPAGSADPVSTFSIKYIVLVLPKLSLAELGVNEAGWAT